MDPSTALGAIVTDTLATIGGTTVLAVLAWFSGPLKWFINSRALRQLISNNRRFNFTLNPDTGQNKAITSKINGEVGEGKNQNESTWKVKRGVLEIYAADGATYSRFSHDKASGHLKHTNEPELRSIHGQFMQPSLVRVALKAEQAVPADRPKAGSG